MTPNRAQKFKSVIANKQPDLTVILEDVHDSHNIAAILRTCDAVGVIEVHIVHTTNIDYCKLGRENPTGKKVSGNVMKWMDISYHEDMATCIAVLKEKHAGLKVFATHMSEEAQPLYALELHKPVALLFGNEREGVSQEALALSDGNFLVPQLGMAQSLNVSVACAVSLFEAQRQRKEAGLYPHPQNTPEVQDRYFKRWAEIDAQMRNPTK